MNWRNLIETARQQAGQTQIHPAGRPTQEQLKRSISSAYYAMFHALCRSNADTLTGTGNAPLARETWTRTYRALNHQRARRQLLQTQRRLPAPAQTFAEMFDNMQTQRNEADYNPHSRFGRDQVTKLLEAAEAATEEFMQMPRGDRRAVAALVLLQDRRAD